MRAEPVAEGVLITRSQTSGVHGGKRTNRPHQCASACGNVGSLGEPSMHQRLPEDARDHVQRDAVDHLRDEAEETDVEVCGPLDDERWHERHREGEQDSEGEPDEAGLEEGADEPVHREWGHDSVALRENRTTWRGGDRTRFITARRLSDWLVSDWHHKRRHMELPDLDFEPVRSGLFYSLRLGGTWVAADWWLQYFAVDERTVSLRLEHLAADLNRRLLPLLPPGVYADPQA